MRECKTRVGVKWWRRRGAFSQICWGFTTQVNITCSLPSHNSSPMAPRARQQATVSQEAQTGPTLHNWGRFAAETRKKRRNIPTKRAEGEKPGLVCCLNCLELCVIGRRNRIRRPRPRVPAALLCVLDVMGPDRSARFAELLALTNRWTWLQGCVRWTSPCQSQSRNEHCKFLVFCCQRRDVFGLRCDSRSQPRKRRLK